MTLREAFQHQIDNTRLLNEDDLKPDDSIYPVVWNGVIFRPLGNYYSSGKAMNLGDKMVIAYEVTFEDTPTPIIMEESEIEEYEQWYTVMRVVENVPVLQHRYRNDYPQDNQTDDLS
jgi:hypothetical protein